MPENLHISYPKTSANVLSKLPMTGNLVQYFLDCITKITSLVEFLQLSSLSRYSSLLDMQIIRCVTSHCITIFEKASFI